MQRAKYIFGRVQWGTLAHWGLSVSVPLAVLLLVQLELIWMAVAVILASKWRVIAVQPRHWVANIRTNSLDLFINLSFLVFLVTAELFVTKLFWTALYIGWLVYVKPQRKDYWVGLQALLLHFLGLSALFVLADDLNETFLIGLAWLIAISGARHFISHFEEPLIGVMTFGWGFFVAQMTWLLNRWLIVYRVSSDIAFAQIAVIISLIAYVIGSLYFLERKDQLRRKYTRQYTIIGFVILAIIVFMSNWDISK
jgi:hypothetical protein